MLLRAAARKASSGIAASAKYQRGSGIGSSERRCERKRRHQRQNQSIAANRQRSVGVSWRNGARARYQHLKRHQRKSASARHQNGGVYRA